MAYYVGLDVSLKTTAICVVDHDQQVVWRGSTDTHPEMILNALDRWVGSIARLGLETGSTSPWLARALRARGLPVVVMDARRVAAALEARRGIGAWIDYYDAERPHSSLGGLTPDEAYETSRRDEKLAA